jgi:hypothetical protein
MYAIFSIVIDIEFDEVRRSEDIDGTKHTPCLNFCFFMMLYMIRASDYFDLLKINCHFFSTYIYIYFL